MYIEYFVVLAFPKRSTILPHFSSDIILPICKHEKEYIASEEGKFKSLIKKGIKKGFKIVYMLTTKTS